MIILSIIVACILTEQRNGEILKLLQIYKGDQKSKFMLTYMLFDKYTKWLGSSHAYITHMIYGRKEWSFTENCFTILVGGLFIAGV